MTPLTIRINNLRPKLFGGLSTLKTRKIQVDSYNRAINDILELMEEQEFIYTSKELERT